MEKEAKIVISLTTLPDRLKNDAILQTLKSLWNQTVNPDAIYLGIPPVAKRSGKSYPEPSEEIKKYATIVDIEKDFGPVTKILGGLYAEQDPSTIIITVDDDNMYDSTFIETMLKAHQQRPLASIGSAGVVVGQFPGYFAYIRNGIGGRYEAWWGDDVPESGQQMDILCGYAGVLYLREMFPEIDHLKEQFLALPLSDDAVFLHDDVYISCYVNSRGYERWVYNMPEVTNVQHYEDSLSGDMWDFYPKLIKAYKSCCNAGMVKSKVCIPYRHTITGRVAIAFLVIVLIIIIIAVIVKYKK